MNNYKSNRLSPPSEDGVLNARRIPARIDSRMTAAILGFQDHDVPVLVSAGLLNPLGKPVQNATKYFASCEIESLAQDCKWLCKATQIVYDCWKEKNKIRIRRDSDGETIPTFPKGQGTSKAKDSETSLSE